jgi:predicted DNA binding CopG/RHH family protein
MGRMKKLDRYEREILGAYEKGTLVSARAAGLGIFRDAARATFIKNRRVNIRLSAADLQDIQAKAYAEGIPYQTLIASVLHKYVSGRLQEKRVRPAAGSAGAARKRAAR